MQKIDKIKIINKIKKVSLTNLKVPKKLDKKIATEKEKTEAIYILEDTQATG